MKTRLIFISSNSLKGSGFKQIFEFDDSEPLPFEAFLSFVQSVDRNKRLRINLGDEWACMKCKSINITKSNSMRCGYCKLIGRTADKIQGDSEVLFNHVYERNK